MLKYKSEKSCNKSFLDCIISLILKIRTGKNWISIPYIAEYFNVTEHYVIEKLEKIKYKGFMTEKINNILYLTTE